MKYIVYTLIILAVGVGGGCGLLNWVTGDYLKQKKAQTETILAKYGKSLSDFEEEDQTNTERALEALKFVAENEGKELAKALGKDALREVVLDAKNRVDGGEDRLDAVLDAIEQYVENKEDELSWKDFRKTDTYDVAVYTALEWVSEELDK